MRAILGAILCLCCVLGCSNEENQQSVLNQEEFIGAAPQLNLEERTAYAITRDVIYNSIATDTLFRDGREYTPRLSIEAIQLPDKKPGSIQVRVSVIGKVGHKTIYSNYPVLVGYPAHVLLNGPSSWSARHHKKDTFHAVIYRTDNFGSFTFTAQSQTNTNDWIELDVGGRTYKVALIDS